MFNKLSGSLIVSYRLIIALNISLNITVTNELATAKDKLFISSLDKYAFYFRQFSVRTTVLLDEIVNKHDIVLVLKHKYIANPCVHVKHVLVHR